MKITHVAVQSPCVCTETNATSTSCSACNGYGRTTSYITLEEFAKLFTWGIEEEFVFDTGSRVRRNILRPRTDEDT